MPFCVALVAMPWPLADRPSIQLAALKAYLLQQFQGAVHVRAWHPYVSVAAHLGLDLYQRIAEETWLAEAIYTPLVFPEQLPHAQALVRRLSGRKPAEGFPPDLETLGQRIQRIHQQDHFFEQLAQAHLVGISVCLAQLMASLHLVFELKRRSPQTPVVLGGSSVCGDLGRSLLKAFPEIDMVVNGEGERPLAALVSRMMRATGRAPTPIPGLLERSPAGAIMGAGRTQITSLDDLPFPDFDDYFKDLRDCPESRPWVGQLPIESSRGCYWHRVRPTAPHRGCQFCNLNLQWKGYRSKRPQRVVHELAQQAERHKTLRFSFVDNALNPRRSLVLMKELQHLRYGLDVFAELRGPLGREQFREMRLAGVKQVQIGIEALSTSLLGKMRKGLRAIDNIEMMKWCEAFGIRNSSNLLLGFPGSDAHDVTDTLATLEFVRSYQPLRVVRFWLGEGSPVYHQANAYGLLRVGNHPWYRALFPAEVLEQLCLMHKGYRGDQTRQKSLWQPVRHQVALWRRQYQAAKGRRGAAPLLGFSDGGSFMIVRRRTATSDHLEAYRFNGKSREIFLFCDIRRNLQEVFTQFSPLSPKKIEDFLNDLVGKRLMFREGDQILGLAVNEDIRALVEPEGCR
jgi:ribosomal peptide maturation radical SAM protein 1